MLHVNHGTNLYGRVLNVPGVLYVATVFSHVAFVPLAPRTSWIVLEEPGLAKYFRASTQWRGIPLVAPVWRSVFAAWLRTALVLFGLWHLVAEGYHALTRWEPVAWPWVAVGLAALALAAASGRFGRASFEQISALLRAADAPDALAVRVERAFGQKIVRSWPGRSGAVRQEPHGVPGSATDAGLGAAIDEEEESSGDDLGACEPFAQRHAPRIFGALGIAAGVLLLLLERASALERGRYHPKLLALGCVMIALGVPAVALGIGRNRDLRVTWKAAVAGLALLAGLAAAWFPEAWLLR